MATRAKDVPVSPLPSAPATAIIFDLAGELTITAQQVAEEHWEAVASMTPVQWAAVDRIRKADNTRNFQPSKTLQEILAAAFPVEAEARRNRRAYDLSRAS